MSAELTSNTVVATPVAADKSLLDCCQGETVTIHAIDHKLSCALRLRELGLVEGTPVRLLKQSDPLLILVRDSRIAIDTLTAREIKVVCNCVADTSDAAGSN